MNKEEQEAIEKFRYGTPLNYQTVIRKLKHDKITDIAITRKEYIDTILNYIDKLQKENEELKEKYENINWYFENQKDNFVHKNQIRTKIKELEEKQIKLNKEASEDIFLNLFERNMNEVSHIVYTKNILRELLNGETKDEE